jgi:hypothetical protein
MPVLVPEVLDSSTMFAIVRSLEISLAAGTRLRRTAKVLGGGLPGSTALVGCLELLLGWFWPANQRSDVRFRLEGSLTGRTYYTGNAVINKVTGRLESFHG